MPIVYNKYMSRPKGYKHTKEAKENMRKAQAGHFGYTLGLKHSDKTKQILRDKQLGKNNSFYGKKHKPETIEKMSKASLNCSIETRKKISIANSGSNNGAYIEDRTKIKPHRTFSGTAYRNWSKNVKIRDNYMCKINNKDCNGRLESHHILNWRDYPELRYEINNGITLCHTHHPRGKANEERLSPYFQELLLNNKN